MALVWFPELTPCVGRVCCWLSSLFRGFFSRFSGSPPSTESNISKFQFSTAPMPGYKIQDHNKGSSFFLHFPQVTDTCDNSKVAITSFKVYKSKSNLQRVICFVFFNIFFDAFQILILLGKIFVSNISLEQWGFYSIIHQSFQVCLGLSC